MPYHGIIAKFCGIHVPMHFIIVLYVFRSTELYALQVSLVEVCEVRTTLDLLICRGPAKLTNLARQIRQAESFLGY